ncbi:MAG TPA: HAMP domain-containing protein, partial [Symbiobacteriaceae bacterium]|nr:HAMP domain-containing protein [Symbiobacteriaceae bacterium]
MRPGCDGARCGLQTGRLLKGSLLSRLALTNIAAVVLAAVAAGVGVRRFAYLVIVQGDMMTMDKLPQFLSQTRLYLGLVAMATVLVAGLAAWLLFRQIIRPLQRMEEVAASVAAGDYSRRVQAQGTDEVGRLAGAIDAMTESLSQVEQLRRDLIANVAHELRTPLTATQGLLHAMRDGLMEPSQRNLDAAGEELGRLTRLVEALHQLSLTDAVPRGGLPCGPVDLVALVDEVLTGMMPLFEQKAIRAAWRPPGEPVWALANRDAL